jgi:S1-C subfamily serine protease
MLDKVLDWRMNMNAMFAEVRALTSAAVLTAALLIGTTVVAAEAEKKAAEVGKKDEMSDAQLEQKLESARKRLDAAAREVAELSMSMSGDIGPDIKYFRAGGPKAMLGINLGPRGQGSDEGVEVVSVSPGGAAAEAGLKAGDVLVEVNGKSLKRDSDSAPREKLMRQMREVNPGDKVVVSYKREGKMAKATLTAQRLADHVFTTFARTMPPMFRGGPAAGAMAFGGPGFAFGAVEGAFGSAELVPLTPKLGQYFGTDKGLLVVRAPGDSRLKLEDGDVIVDIDGRSPSNPLHALRILSSYQAGEKLKLNVLRMKKKMSFDITVPEDPWEGRLEDAHFMQAPDVMFQDPLNIQAVPALPGPMQPADDVSITLQGPDGPV